MSHRLCRSPLGTTLVVATPPCIFDRHPLKVHSQRPGLLLGRRCISISSRPTVLLHTALLTALLNTRSNLSLSPSHNPSHSTSNMFSFLSAPQLFPACPTITSSSHSNSHPFTGNTTQRAHSRTRLRLLWKVRDLAATHLCTPHTPRGHFTGPPAPHPAPHQEASL